MINVATLPKLSYIGSFFFYFFLYSTYRFAIHAVYCYLLLSELSLLLCLNFCYNGLFLQAGT